MRTVVGIAVIGMSLLLVGCGGANRPSATFDGEQCQYSGPESVGSGDIEVTFENNSGEAASLAFLALRDESARAEAAATMGTRTSVGGAPPPDYMELVGQLPADPNATATQTAPLTSGTYFLDCVTFGLDGPNEVWRVAILEVG
jgi:hypothetical protein